MNNNNFSDEKNLIKQFDGEKHEMFQQLLNTYPKDRKEIIEHTKTADPIVKISGRKTIQDNRNKGEIVLNKINYNGTTYYVDSHNLLFDSTAKIVGCVEYDNTKMDTYKVYITTDIYKIKPVDGIML